MRKRRHQCHHKHKHWLRRFQFSGAYFSPIWPPVYLPQCNFLQSAIYVVFVVTKCSVQASDTKASSPPCFCAGCQEWELRWQARLELECSFCRLPLRRWVLGGQLWSPHPHMGDGSVSLTLENFPALFWTLPVPLGMQLPDCEFEACLSCSRLFLDLLHRGKLGKLERVLIAWYWAEISSNLQWLEIMAMPRVPNCSEARRAMVWRMRYASSI